MLPPEFHIDPMSRTELATLIGWAEAEGWNPGHSDPEVAWAVDPDAFLALRRNGELVGGGSIISYGGEFGFMGLFIIREDLRREGLGRSLWFERRDRLIARLRPGASIGMDGVVALAPFYARGGFTLERHDVRFEGRAEGSRDTAAVELPDLDRELVHAYDRWFFPTSRRSFLDRWLDAPGVAAAGIMGDDGLRGFAALRPCASGYKFGPVNAETPAIAERLLAHLESSVEGSVVQLDVPETNGAGMDLALSLGWAPTFTCARMYLGGVPELPVEKIYGVTSFEFG